MFTEAELDEEADHIHVVGFMDPLSHSIAATAVLVPEGNKLKMQRVAVTDELRNKNIGSEMMKFCEHWALENKYLVMYCHARNTAVNFYLKNHYSIVGDYFDEDGIPHVRMEKALKSNPL
ncbi:MAG: hypothetical protein SchgKO_05490 [Schleiferiaceae bacterium]